MAAHVACKGCPKAPDCRGAAPDAPWPHGFKGRTSLHYARCVQALCRSGSHLRNGHWLPKSP